MNLRPYSLKYSLGLIAISLCCLSIYLNVDVELKNYQEWEGQSTLQITTSEVAALEAVVDQLPELSVLEVTDDGAESGQNAAHFKTIAQKVALQELVLWNFRVLPKWAYAFDELKILRLHNCDISTLPYHSVVLPPLEELHVVNGFFKELPTLPQPIPTLRLLNVSDNMIVKLPDNLFYYPNLEELILDRNPLEDFRVALSYPNITTLRVREISLDANLAPLLLKTVPKLEVLDWSGAILDTIPKWLVNCTHLKHLNLSNNNLSGNLKSLCELPQLQYLNLHGNHFIDLSNCLESHPTLVVDKL